MSIELGVNLSRLSAAIFTLATLVYLAYIFVGKGQRKAIGQAGTTLLVVGILAHIASLAVRTIVTQRPPFMNVYEFILTFTLSIALIYFILELNTRNKAFGAFAMPLIALFAIVATLMNTEVNPIMPALRSAWRVPHIASAVLGYSAFGIAFVIAIVYLIQVGAERKEGSFWADRLPGSKKLDEMTYKTVQFGFLMLTFAILTGALWAQFAWGRYWGWDPKEVWSAITWLIYATYLHTRVTLGWKGDRSAVVAIIGFVATMFTLLGVSFLLTGLHSYG